MQQENQRTSRQLPLLRVPIVRNMRSPRSKMKELLKQRQFQTWDYVVTHGQLLIRSPQDRQHRTNIDLIFGYVDFMQIPRHFEELELGEPTAVEVESVTCLVPDRMTDKKLHVLLCKGRRYLVLARHFSIQENAMNIMDSSLMRAGE